MTPRRYRLAMWACPAPYRRARGTEIFTTLEDSDRERDGPSAREAIALLRHGIGLRIAAPYAAPLLAVLGILAITAALAPDGWWGHHPVLTTPTSDGGFGPNPPVFRMVLAATGLVALGTARPRTAVAIALATPYAVLVSSDLEMAYGLQAFRVRAGEALPLAAISVMVATGAAGTIRTMRRTALDTAMISTGLAGSSAAALLATVQASTEPWGSGGPGYPLGPNILGDFGLPTLACAAVLLASSAVVARTVPRRTPTAA